MFVSIKLRVGTGDVQSTPWEIEDTELGIVVIDRYRLIDALITCYEDNNRDVATELFNFVIAKKHGNSWSSWAKAVRLEASAKPYLEKFETYMLLL